MKISKNNFWPKNPLVLHFFEKKKIISGYRPENFKGQISEIYFLLHTSANGLPFFLIATLHRHSSQVFFTAFLNHVSRQWAWTYLAEPAHWHGVTNGSSPAEWQILQIHCVSDISRLSLPTISVCIKSSRWNCWRFFIILKTRCWRFCFWSTEFNAFSSAWACSGSLT